MTRAPSFTHPMAVVKATSTFLIDGYRQSAPTSSTAKLPQEGPVLQVAEPARLLKFYILNEPFQMGLPILGLPMDSWKAGGR
jgi:hypothetical protein